MSTTTPTQRIGDRAFSPWVTTALVVIAAVTVALALLPEGLFVFKATWLLHPFEQEHLGIARNLAHGGGLTITGEPASVFYGSEDRGFIEGRYVPRGMLLPYFIYAGTFLVSDTAWLLVTPLFGFLGACAACLIVRSRTDSVAAGVAAGAALFFTSPYLLAASGLAFENMIAVAFLLWGVYALECFTHKPSPWRGAVVGLLFAAVAGTRADYALSTLVVVAFLAAWLVFVRLRLRTIPTPAWTGALAGVAGAAAGIVSIFATNFAITGDPLQTAYGEQAWQGSASGVARNFLHFQPGDFARLAELFLWDIGQPATVLMCLGAVLYFANRRFHPGDVVLLSLTAFLVVLHIGRAGLHGTQEAFLVSSPPRYLLPVYATGVVIGFNAIAVRLRTMNLGPSAAAILLAVGLVAAVAGVRELYLNSAGAVSAQQATARHRAVYEFSTRYPDALFVGDLDTVAIIGTQRLLVPRLVHDMDKVIDLVDMEQEAGRRVFLVDDRRHLVDNPLYSGYYEALGAGGYIACATTESWPVISEVLSPEGSAAGLDRRVSVPATDAVGVELAGLSAGQSYFLVVSGQFQYSRAGGTSDGVDLWLGATRMSEQPNKDHRYCRKVTAGADPMRLTIVDSTYTDNAGSLTVAVFRAD